MSAVRYEQRDSEICLAQCRAYLFGVSKTKYKNTIEHRETPWGNTSKILPPCAKAQHNIEKRNYLPMTFIDEIYTELNAVSPISTDAFSTDYLAKNKSYLRSLRARNLESSTGTLLTLMETLHAESDTLRYGNSNKLLHQVAMKKAALALRTGEEIAARTLSQASTSKWVRETLLRIITGINTSAVPSEDYELPIIIC